MTGTLGMNLIFDSIAATFQVLTSKVDNFSDPHTAKLNHERNDSWKILY